MRDEAIIRAIQRGDEGAIAGVITRYARLMWSVAGSVLRGVGSDQDVEECVADVFVYLWQHPDKFDPRRGSLRSWLAVVARSQAVDRCRALARSAALPLDDGAFSDQAGLWDGMLREETKAALASAIKTLDQPEQEIFLRRYYYDQKPKEIALALGIPGKKVENTLYRAKRKLRAIIAGHEKGGPL